MGALVVPGRSVAKGKGIHSHADRNGSPSRPCGPPGMTTSYSYRASLRSGDQVGSDAKDGVGTGCSTRPVMSTM